MPYAFHFLYKPKTKILRYKGLKFESFIILKSYYTSKFKLLLKLQFLYFDKTFIVYTVNFYLKANVFLMTIK